MKVETTNRALLIFDIVLLLACVGLIFKGLNNSEMTAIFCIIAILPFLNTLRSMIKNNMILLRLHLIMIAGLIAGSVAFVINENYLAVGVCALAALSIIFKIASRNVDITNQEHKLAV